jgi:oligoribonuclease NrnB/cAMP/cGMP phosphodiesterase (DHH superfamily)
MKCFYHNDLDGQCAAFCVRKYNIDTVESDFIEMNYGKPFPFELVVSEEQVFIVDYSISPEEMDRLLEITDNVIWIDHHQTAIENYSGYDKRIKGLICNGISGCELTYLYLSHFKHCQFKESLDKLRDGIPSFIRYIGDRDTWQWEYGEKTRKFCAGMGLYDCSPFSDIWNKLEYGACERIMNQGETVLKFYEQSNREYANAFAYRTEFEGYPAIACNIGKSSSELFDSVKDKPELLIMFVFDGDIFHVSLRSESIDVAEIAKKYGGGGHKNPVGVGGAAGFEIKELPFKKLEK